MTMHEYSIIQALVDSVGAAVVKTGAASADGAEVRHIRIEIGDLAGVDIGLLTTAYEVFRFGTICAHATLEITPVRAQWACPRCDGIIARGSVLQCPLCGVPAALTRGDEIVLARVELAVPGPDEADTTGRAAAVSAEKTDSIPITASGRI